MRFFKKNTPQTIDLSSKVWGCDYIWRPDEKTQGKKGSLTGWSPTRFKKGDYVLLRDSGHGDGKTRYKVTEVKWYYDPKDMFRATVKFTPRKKPEDFEPPAKGSEYV